ncbi:hypothetical protein FKM82_029518 [Ascaphus truei]
MLPSFHICISLTLIQCFSQHILPPVADTASSFSCTGLRCLSAALLISVCIRLNIPVINPLHSVHSSLTVHAAGHTQAHCVSVCKSVCV